MSQIGYMNTCFKCGEMILMPFAKEFLTTFETCIHITAFENLL
jgi:hypothetical protein